MTTETTEISVRYFYAETNYAPNTVARFRSRQARDLWVDANPEMRWSVSFEGPNGFDWKPGYWTLEEARDGISYYFITYPSGPAGREWIHYLGEVKHSELVGQQKL